MRNGKATKEIEQKLVLAYLESSSKRKELLTALFESSVIITLMFAITYGFGKSTINIVSRQRKLNYIQVKHTSDETL